VLERYEAKLPRATAHQRVLLKVLQGDLFRQKLSQYARPMLVKGVPPLITDLKEMYNDPEKSKIIEEMLLSHIKSMELNQTLAGDDDEEQDPTVYLWLLFFTAQHFYILRDFERALLYVNQGIEHTPTVVDLYVLKARIYKKAGDRAYAAKLYDEARKLDLADRYLNAVSARFKIRADQVEDAEETMALFSKEGNELNVHDMQCLWYEIEVGQSYLRQGKYRLALKNFHFVEKHLEQICEDQSDFHLYAIRKYTIGAYLQMLDMMDNIYRNRNAVRSAVGIIKTMSKVQKVREAEQKLFEPEMEAYRNSDDYRKLLEEIKKRDEDDEYRQDSDPKGFELYEKSLKDPMGKALEITVLVADKNPDDKELQAKAMPVFLAKEKLSLAFKCLQILIEKHPNYEKTLVSRIKFAQHWTTLTDEQRKKGINDENLLPIHPYQIANKEVETTTAD